MRNAARGMASIHSHANGGLVSKSMTWDLDWVVLSRESNLAISPPDGCDSLPAYLLTDL